MNISVDLSEFTGNWEELARRLQQLPQELMEEAARVVELVMKRTAPYRTGALKSSIYPTESEKVVMVGPHVYYAPYVEVRGRSKGYIERAAAAAEPLLPQAIQARAQEYVEVGR